MNTFSGYGRISNKESKQTGDKLMVKFSLGIRRQMKGTDGKYAYDNIPCIIFGKPAEMFDKYFANDDHVLVRGTLQSHKVTTPEGKNMTYYSVVVTDIYFTESRKTSQQTAGQDDVPPAPFDV